MSEIYTHIYNSPLGPITLASDGKYLTGLRFEKQKQVANKPLPVFKKTEKWLDAYFGGERPKVLPPIYLKGTDFQKEVWEILLTIPYGVVMTYGQIADIIASRKGTGKMSAQAIGVAVGHNPIAIIVPCHRVIGAGGKLTGYAWGLDKKEWLLNSENRYKEGE